MRRDHRIVLALVLLTLGVFWRVALYDFVNYDDPDYVTGNLRVQDGLTVEGVAWAFGQLHGTATYWHPLTWLSHMLDCQLFGLNPAGHHLVSLLFHLANSVLLFLVLQRMTGAFWRSALLAALFALHPLQVETVAWVAERKNVLSTCLWILTLGAYTIYVEKPGRGRYVLVVVLAFALGLMAKPMLVTLPCALLLLDFWPLRRTPFRPAPGAEPATVRRRFAPASTARLIGEKLPLLAMAAAMGAVTILAHRGLGMTGYGYGVSPILRLENALVSYVRYLGKTLWPTDLSVLYIHPGKWPGWMVGASLLLLAVVTGLALRQWRRAPYLAVGWLWFLGTLVPVIGLIQVGVQAMANRFAYVPVIGLFIMIVWGLTELCLRWKISPAEKASIAVGVLGGCVLLSSHHLRHWRNSQTLFEYAVQVAPDNFVAHHNLAVALVAKGKLDRALEHAREAVRLRPTYTEARCQVGSILLAQQKPADAIPHLREAIRLKPDWALPRAGLARALAQQGQIDEAIAEQAAAVDLQPREAVARAELAALLHGRHRTAEAIAQYRESLRLLPDLPEALNDLAWILATHPQPEFRDGAEAVRLAEHACQLTENKRALLVGTLAAAYAETGRFDDAVKAAERARDTAQAAGEQPIADTNRKLLELYRAGKPCRETAQPSPALPL